MKIEKISTNSLASQNNNGMEFIVDLQNGVTPSCFTREALKELVKECNKALWGDNHIATNHTFPMVDHMNLIVGRPSTGKSVLKIKNILDQLPDFLKKPTDESILSLNDAPAEKTHYLPFNGMRQLTARYRVILKAFDEDQENIIPKLEDLDIPVVQCDHGFIFNMDGLSEKQIEFIKNLPRPLQDAMHKHCEVITVPISSKELECLDCDKKWTKAEPIIMENNECPNCGKFHSSKQLNK